MDEFVRYDDRGGATSEEAFAVAGLDGKIDIAISVSSIFSAESKMGGGKNRDGSDRRPEPVHEKTSFRWNVIHVGSPHQAVERILEGNPFARQVGFQSDCDGVM